MRGIVLFAMLFLISSAVPVLAADGGEQPAEGAQIEALGEPAPVTPPDEHQVQEGLEAAEREQAARQRELEEPELTRQREESRNAFADVSGADAQQLLLTVFSAQMAMLNADPARYLSDVEVLRTYGGSAATVRDKGDGSLLEAGIPVRTENAEGDLEKVDLSLQPTTSGFEPANPLAELHIPDSADEVIEIGEEGLAISSIGAEEESKAQVLGGKDVWFSEAQTDTDLLVSPIAGGVELFDQLRSADSPEVLRFQLDLPEGAELRGNGAGGAEIVKEGEMLAVVAPPSAIDAQGTVVPVELEVQGNTITLHVPHREGDFAYPLLVDPAIREEAENAWYFGSNLAGLSAWDYKTNDPTETYHLHSSYCLTAALCSPSGRGLFISFLNRNIPANTFAHYYYNVPGTTTYIPSIYPEYSAYLNPFWRNNASCSWESYKQPHDYDGSYDAAGNWLWLETDRAQWYGNAAMFTKAKGIAFGMGSGGGVNIPCWRNIMLGGVVIRLDDPETPTLSSVTGIPSGWVGSTGSFTITANAQDPGLGVQNVTMAPEGMPVVLHTPAQNQCPGTKVSPCPASNAAQLNVTATLFDEGEKGVKFSAYDPTGKTSTTYSATTRVDRTPPEVVLDGQLAVATDEEEGDSKDPEKWDALSLPVYNLEVKASDGSKASPATKRSGVKSVEVFLDAKTTPEKSWTSSSCPESSCPMTQVFTLKLNELSAITHHTLKVVVKDFANNKPRERNIEFEYVPATGITDEYVMQYFPLPDGQGNEAEEEHPSRPELAVNVVTGNLVYREQDIEVEGTAVDLEVERYYNSLLPASQNTEWGDGWTLAQTPTLEPREVEAPGEATMVEDSGAVESSVDLPEKTGQERFDQTLHAVVRKEPGGVYEVTDESGETDTAVAFSASGEASELRTSGYATVDYDYEAGKLSEIAVDDPASVSKAGQEEPSGEIDETPVFISAFGSNGSEAGELKLPTDVERDAAGNVWVADWGNNRIQKFDSNGKFLFQLGSFGTGDGQFRGPWAIAAGPEGNIWVTDFENCRIQKFNSIGQNVGKFGVCGSGNGQFRFPMGIALDLKGNIWVSDSGNNRLQKFSSSGEFIKAVGSGGTGPGQFSSTTGIDVAPSGLVFVGDRHNHRVSVFNEAGEFVRQIGSKGAGDGQFGGPVGIDVDALGRVWVGDEENARVQVFDEEGKYIAKFGSKGAGDGQFNMGPRGIATDDKGGIWATDQYNHRVQRWAAPYTDVLYANAVGSSGAGNGQLSIPADAAVDSAGNLWVLDKGNNRLQKFDSNGQYMSKFGSGGSENGQFKAASAIAIDPEGDILVADTGNNRIQRFNSKGEYLSKFGSAGAGNGQFNSPSGIAVAPDGSIFVSDRLNHRIQRFTKAGVYFGQTGSFGWEDLYFNEPTALAIGAPSGAFTYTVFVVDSGNNRVKRYTPTATLLSKFGSSGTANGQLNSPSALEIDSQGHVWVGDRANSRVQLFDEEGKYVDQFGSKGSGEGQFNLTYPMGIASDAGGGVWVTDGSNSRAQKWIAGAYAPENEELPQDDPSVDVTLTSGLVAKVEGEEAGTNSYAYSGDDLVSHTGPQGKATYQYDSAGRMTEVTLPNGTWGQIAYEPTYGRVKSVTVDPAGSAAAKTTSFEYSDAPRRTTVVVPDAPHITYDIAADGSVLKWWNTQQPPQLDDLSGSLYANRETASPISIGTHNLVAQAHSEEGIFSIQFIAHGSQLIDEMTCQQDPEKAGLECLTVINEWVTETGALAPGILQLEVLTTDRLGQTESERFWVNIPYTPPEPPGAVTPPKFMDILRFREEYGLEVVFPVANELELNDRIFDLIGAWYNPQTPAGEVARASMERWGVPLRPEDVAELEYRESYLAHDGPIIDQWGANQAASSYAGYYIDHRAGGKLRVGFTANASANLDAVKGQSGLLASPDRFSPFSQSPTRTIADLSTLRGQVGPGLNSQASLAGLVTRVGMDIEHNQIVVHATDPAKVSSTLTDMFGVGVPVSVVQDDGQAGPMGRFRTSGPVFAGDHLAGEPFLCATDPKKYCRARCSAGFGAWERKFSQPKQQYVRVYFTLAAGHCWSNAASVYRQLGEVDFPAVEYGVVERYVYLRDENGAFTDAEAVRPKNQEMYPRKIYREAGVQQPVKGLEQAKQGARVCFSGYKTNQKACGPVLGPAEEVHYSDRDVPSWLVPVRVNLIKGDSGAPVWLPHSGKAVGLAVYGGGGLMWYTPLIPPQGAPPSQAPGVLRAPGMGDLNLATVK